MSFFKVLDAYTLRARLFPAVLAAAPALAALALLISWEKIALSNMIATGIILVLLMTWSAPPASENDGSVIHGTTLAGECPRTLVPFFPGPSALTDVFGKVQIAR